MKSRGRDHASSTRALEIPIGDSPDIRKYEGESPDSRYISTTPRAPSNRGVGTIHGKEMGRQSQKATDDKPSWEVYGADGN